MAIMQNWGADALEIAKMQNGMNVMAQERRHVI